MKLFKMEGTLVENPNIRLELYLQAEDWSKAMEQVDKSKIQIVKLTEMRDVYSPGSVG